MYIISYPIAMAENSDRDGYMTVPDTRLANRFTQGCDLADDSTATLVQSGDVDAMDRRLHDSS